MPAQTFCNPQPYPASIQQAQYKAIPNDFIVHEVMTIDFSEAGEHLWVHLEKTNLNTVYVTKLLAKWANIPDKDVGYSGLKDRHAVTTQWFSLRIPNKTAPSTDFREFYQPLLGEDETINVLAQHWHHKKLNRGTHSANQFILTLRDVVGDKSDIEKQLAQIRAQGVPNYIGEQRFGIEGNNIERVLALFATGKLNGKKVNRKFDQDKISLLLSAARSALFNAILAKRVSDGSWDTVQLGDVMNLSGSNSIFVIDGQDNRIDDTLAYRLASGDVHITGALWGDGLLKSQFDVATLEQGVIDSDTTYQALAAGLVNYGLKQQRRPLRLIPQDLHWQWLYDDSLQLDFSLPAGSFATTVLAALLANH